MTKGELLAGLEGLPDDTELFGIHEEFGCLVPFTQAVRIAEAVDGGTFGARRRPSVIELLPGMGTAEPRRTVAILE